MAKKKLELSKAEWEIMQSIWESGERLSVRDVMDRRYPNGEKAYTTVQTLMNILVDKEILTRKKERTINIYFPRVEREAVLQKSMNSVAQSMFSGSFGAMASYLVSSAPLTKKDIEQLKKLLDEAGRESS